MTPANHLDEADLAVGAADLNALTDERRAHVDECSECASDLRLIADLADAAPLTSSAEVPIADPGPSAPPMRGELWRVASGAVAELALVWTEPRPWVRVFPATVDPGYSDEQSAVLPTDSSNLGMGLSIWCGLGFDLPTEVFDQKLGVITASAIDIVGAVYRSVSRQEPVDAGFIGASITSRMDDRFEYRAILSDRFTCLADEAVLDEETIVPDPYARAARQAGSQDSRSAPSEDR